MESPAAAIESLPMSPKIRSVFKVIMATLLPAVCETFKIDAAPLVFPSVKVKSEVCKAPVSSSFAYTCDSNVTLIISLFSIPSTVNIEDTMPSLSITPFIGAGLPVMSYIDVPAAASVTLTLFMSAVLISLSSSSVNLGLPKL